MVPPSMDVEHHYKVLYYYKQPDRFSVATHSPTDVKPAYLQRAAAKQLVCIHIRNAAQLCNISHSTTPV